MFTLKDHQAKKELEQNMVDKLKVKERIARGDGSVAPHHLSGEAPPADTGRVDGEGKVKPHDRESEVATSIELEKLICPRCGKPTLHAEFPDHYEAWTKCSDCGFFMGMSNEDWHRMESSSNLSEKIRKMALKRELVKS
jgi:ribosomal protein S27AE